MKFYGHFAAAYGTIWLAMVCVALVTQKHINAGQFGMFGFPVIAFFYALLRMASDNSSSEVLWLRERVAVLEDELARRSDSDD